ncbi:hypothetical protein BG004_005418 [Podila humilis]|nr:hypothetical protein BG004_005418 [Podila humilis]
MGCDGGSIPKRDELVKQKQKQVKVDQNIINRVQWFSCALSKRALESPVVSCGLGKLYNRDAILEFLLDRSAYGDGDLICNHVKSLKDVVTLKLEPNPSFGSSSSSSSPSDKSHSAQSLTNHDQEPVSRFICPITMKEMNGKHRFVYLDTCGCVLSEQAMKEIPSKTCIKCAKPFQSVNVITLNPKGEELKAMENALAEKQARILAEKKEKKKAKAQHHHKKEVETMNSADPSSLSTTSSSKRKLDDCTTPNSDKKKQKHHISSASNHNHNQVSSTHSLTASVAAKVAEQMAVNAAMRPKSSAIQSLYNNGRVSKENFMNR